MEVKLKVGIIGCGVIGSKIAESCLGALKDGTELVALFDVDKDKLLVLENKLGRKLGISSLDDVFKKSELVIEAASAAVSSELLCRAIEKKVNIMIMSVGGLLGHENLIEEARKKGIRVYLPSGALAGIDAIKAASFSKIDSVTIITRKPLKGLEGAPYLLEKGINIKEIKEETVLFEGSAKQAVKGFPKNINVSALLSLVGIGADKTAVRIVTSPSFTQNSHEVEVKGEFGTIKTQTINVPSPFNPKTSYLAVLSAIATLKGIVDSVRMGT